MVVNDIKNLHGGELIWYVNRKYKIPLQEILCFDNLVSPIHPTFSKPPTHLIKSYPERNYSELKKIISKQSNVKEENIILTTGSTELIYIVSKIFGKRAQIPLPSYSEYESAIKKYQGSPIFTNDYNPVDATLIFICNPNNPTGLLIKKPDMEKTLKKIPLKTKVFLDEAYMGLVSPEYRYSMSSFINAYKNLIVSQTLSKFYGIPSLRLGWGIASKDIINTLKKFKIPLTIDGLTIYHAQKFLQNEEYSKKLSTLIEKERKRLYKKFKEINWLKCKPTYANYFLLEIKGKLTSTELFEILAKNGILIRDCSNIRGLSNKHIRIAIKNPEENNRLIEELKNIST